MYKKNRSIPVALTFLTSMALAASAMAPAFADNFNNQKNNLPKIVGSVTDNNAPDGLAIDEKTNTIYLLGTVFNADYTSANSTLSVLDGYTNKIKKVIPFDSGVLQGVVWNEERDKLFVLVTDPTFTYSTLSLLDAKTDKVLKSVQLSGPGFADDMVLDHKTNKIFLPQWTGPVTVLDAKTLQVVDIVPGDNSYNVGINRKTDKVYVGNIYDATLSVIDAKTDQLIDTILVGTPVFPDDCYKTNNCTINGSHPHGISVNEETNTIYVSNEDGTFVTVDGNTDKVTSTITVANQELYDSAVDEKTNTVYVLVPYEGLVAVIDGKTSKIVEQIPMGALPTPSGCMDFTSQVACTNNGVSPQGIAINHQTGKVYVGVEDNIFAQSPNGEIVIIEANKPDGE